MFRDYWNSEDFQCKKPNKSAWPDNIYQPNGPASLKQVHNPVHCPAEKETDVSGKYVLIFDRAWRISSDEEPFPGEGYRLEMNARRGHRKSPLATDERDRWLDWLKSHASPFDPKEVGGHGTCKQEKRRHRTSCGPC
ncbi:Nmad2 family putative nucleotide modification protein [Roseixanthobacter psychrophilus]|uniref:Nmad2 family putative nucleotide modification protein n=1 Tax=Roseixanthobacter psychrophilus TaxID=3119917 RepID=UPI003D19A1F1